MKVFIQDLLVIAEGRKEQQINPGTTIRFEFENCKIEVRIETDNLGNGCLGVRKMGFGLNDDQISVYPHCANKISIK